MKMIRFAGLVCFLSLTVFGQQMNALTAKEKADGWQLLFDGRTLNGWHSSDPAPPAAQLAPGQVGSNPNECTTSLGKSSSAVPPGGSHWEVATGSLVACGEPAGFLTSDKTFKNFVLSIDFRCAEDTNSGVFVRAPEELDGYEIQIWRQQPAGYNTGSIVNAGKTAKEYKFKPNQWNNYRIEAQGDHLVVSLNGETTLDVHDSKYTQGNLRLQYQKFPVEFRNIKLRVLP